MKELGEGEQTLPQQLRDLTISHFTPRTLELLKFLALGYPLWAVAEKMELKYDTVEKMNNTLSKKVGTNNPVLKTHLALFLGIIKVQNLDELQARLVVIETLENKRKKPLDIHKRAL